MKTKPLISLLSCCLLLNACGNDSKPIPYDPPTTPEVVTDPEPPVPDNNDGDKPDQPLANLDTLYNTLELAQINNKPLGLSEGNDFDNHVKNGLRLLATRYISSGGSGSSSSGSWGGNSSSSSVWASSSFSSSSTVSSSPSSGSSSSSSGGFSGTNVHVEGVDEADIAKYDGKHWYIATNVGNSYYNQQSDNGFQIVATSPSAISAKVVALYKDPTQAVDYGFENEFNQPVGSYYYSSTSSSSSLSGWTSSTSSSSSSGSTGSTSSTSSTGSTSSSSGGTNGYSYLVSLDKSNSSSSSSGSSVSSSSPWIEGMYLVTQNEETSGVATLGRIRNGLRLQMIDVKDPSAPSMDWNLSLEGEMLGSRQVGNTLYVVTQRRIQGWNKLTSEYGSEEQRLSIRIKNEEVLKTLSAEDVMSHYTLDGQTAPLNKECLFENTSNDYLGYINFINITSVNLENKTIESTCLGGNIENLSMTSDAAYVTGSYYDSTLNAYSTVIHKFVLNNGRPDYKATGSIAGTLGFTGDPVSKLSATENDLRIVTSTNARVHSLNILEDKNGVLEPVASLPNKNRPNAIGKPNEEIKSVRFDGNTAYIVTFRTRDPLYAIDLSDRLDPKIKGELVIPGYATYIHPIGDHYLFTLGVDANATTGIASGTKAELFDIASDTPKLITTLILADSADGNNEALYNLNAISILQSSDDQIRIAFPLFETHYPKEWSFGLQMLQLDGINSVNATLVNKGVVTVESNELSPNLNGYSSPGGSRGLIHDDSTFFTHGGAIWAAPWALPAAVTGPILQTPCEGGGNPGIELTLKANDSPASGNLCDTEVFIGDRSSDYIELLKPQQVDSPNQCVFTGAMDRPGQYYFSIHSDEFYAGYAPNVNVISGYCGANTMKQTLAVESIASCNAKKDVRVVVGLLFDDETANTQCNAQMSLNLYDINSGDMIKSFANILPTDKTQLTADDIKLYDENTQCYFQIPVSRLADQYGVIKVEADGYSTNSHYFNFRQEQKSVCSFDDVHLQGYFYK